MNKKRTCARGGVATPACWLTALVLIAGLGTLAAQEAGAATDPSYSSYSRDPGSLVVQYSLMAGELAEQDDTPRLRIYGDGRVLVHYPLGMTKAGDYQLQLTEPEMAELVGALAQSVVDFDSESVSRAKQRASLDDSAITGQLHQVADDATSVIEVRLAAYQSATDHGLLPQPVHKRVSWYGLRTDARHHAQIEPLRALAAAEQRLLDLLERDDLQRTSPLEPREGTARDRAPW